MQERQRAADRRHYAWTVSHDRFCDCVARLVVQQKKAVRGAVGEDARHDESTAGAAINGRQFTQDCCHFSGVVVSLVEFPHPLIVADLQFFARTSDEIITRGPTLPAFQERVRGPTLKPRVGTVNLPQGCAQRRQRFVRPEHERQHIHLANGEHTTSSNAARARRANCGITFGHSAGCRRQTL